MNQVSSRSPAFTQRTRSTRSTGARTSVHHTQFSRSTSIYPWCSLLTAAHVFHQHSVPVHLHRQPFFQTRRVNQNIYHAIWVAEISSHDRNEQSYILVSSCFLWNCSEWYVWARILCFCTLIILCTCGKRAGVTQRRGCFVISLSGTATVQFFLLTMQSITVRNCILEHMLMDWGTEMPWLMFC